MEEKGKNYYQAYKPTLWNRLGFGTCYAHIDDVDYPDMAEAAIHTNVYTHFDWRDRLRILVSGKVMTAIATKTSITVAKAISTSKASVLPPNYPLKENGAL